MIRENFTSAAGRHTHGRRRGCKGNPSGDPGRDDRRSRRGDSAHAVPQAVVAWQPSAPLCACRRVDRGCRARPRSRRRWSGRCGSRSGRQSAIPDDLALSLRHGGSRSGSRYQISSGCHGDATYRSERPSLSGRASLQNSG